MGTVISITIKEDDVKIRKFSAPVGKVFRDKTKYTRNEKHKQKWGGSDKYPTLLF